MQNWILLVKICIENILKSICMQTTFSIEFNQLLITELIAFNFDVIKAQEVGGW